MWGGGGGRSIIVVLWKRFNSGWEENYLNSGL